MPQKGCQLQTITLQRPSLHSGAQQRCFVLHTSRRAEAAFEVAKARVSHAQHLAAGLQSRRSIRAEGNSRSGQVGELRDERHIGTVTGFAPPFTTRRIPPQSTPRKLQPPRNPISPGGLDPRPEVPVTLGWQEGGRRRLGGSR